VLVKPIQERLAQHLHPAARVFRILDAIVMLYIGFIVCCSFLFSVIWIIQVAIPVEPIIGVRNAFWCALLVAFNWMMADSPVSADI
jgi:hypothetical protein